MEQPPPAALHPAFIQEDLLFQTDVQSYKGLRYGLILQQPRLYLRGIILSESPPEIRALNQSTILSGITDSRLDLGAETQIIKHER